MAAATEPQQLSNAILSFALDGHFPEEVTALSSVSETDLNPTITALDKAKADIEVLEPPLEMSLFRCVMF
jgi:centromere/kinetochore protein ZW10